MWMKVSELSGLVGISPRTMQLKISNGQITARRVDRKSYEVDLSSLPREWQERLPESLRDSAGSLTPVPKANSMIIAPEAAAALGKGLSARERKRLEIVSHYRGLDPMMKEGTRCSITAALFGVSPATVRRYAKDVDSFGILGKPSERYGRRSWDQEAEDYMKGWYLSFLKTSSIDSKLAAYNAVKAKALEEGWRVGCRASAYRILDEIPEVIKRYAVAGSRALDNFFYIKRDWSSLKPSQIWIGDQHICDFWVVDKSNPAKWRYYRPTLYVWEDGATRCIAGIAVDEDYTSDTVLEALRMGIVRFGFFDCTYNDNGTSECSKAATQVIEDLLILSGNRSRMRDESELYRTDSGVYVVEDESGNPVSYASTPDEWRRLHRRIYANVKNAKTKPIERLFGTIEGKMAQRGIPGHVITPGCPADQEEKEQHILDYQKAHDMILTLEDFMRELVKGIDEYENAYHSALRMSPLECLRKHIDEGWRAVRPASEEELDFVFLSRTKARIRKGRVTINGRDYIGEDLKTVVGRYADVGLTLHEGEVCDIRYSKLDPEVAYAVFPAAAVKIRQLRPVREVSMLDDEAMKAAIEWKRSQMRCVREAFSHMVAPAAVKAESHLAKALDEAAAAIRDTPAPKIEPPKVHRPERRPNVRLHNSDYDHYRWCIDEQIAGHALSQDEMDFMVRYEARDEYENERAVWDTYRRLGGEEQ